MSRRFISLAAVVAVVFAFSAFSEQKAEAGLLELVFGKKSDCCKPAKQKCCKPAKQKCCKPAKRKCCKPAKRKCCKPAPKCGASRGQAAPRVEETPPPPKENKAPAPTTKA